jgi:hypothetical protein
MWLPYHIEGARAIRSRIFPLFQLAALQQLLIGGARSQIAAKVAELSWRKALLHHASVSCRMKSTLLYKANTMEPKRETLYCDSIWSPEVLLECIRWGVVVPTMPDVPGEM